MPEQPELSWEQLNSSRAEEGGMFNIKIGWEVHRAKVYGGWFVLVRGGGTSSASVTFYPDPEHTWDGGSLT